MKVHYTELTHSDHKNKLVSRKKNSAFEQLPEKAKRDGCEERVKQNGG